MLLYILPVNPITFLKNRLQYEQAKLVIADTDITSKPIQDTIDGTVNAIHYIELLQNQNARLRKELHTLKK